MRYLIICFVFVISGMAVPNPPQPPTPPPASLYKVHIIIERSDTLIEGFRDVATNTFWSSHQQGFYRMRLEVE